MVPEHLQNYIKRCQVVGYQDTDTSDHTPVTMVLDIGLLPRLTFTTKCKERIKWNKWDEAKLVQEYQTPLGIMLANVVQEIHVRKDAERIIEGSFERLVDTLHKAAKVLPRSRFKRNLKSFWTEVLNKLKKEKMFWFKKWKEGGHTLDVNDPIRIRMKVSKKEFIKRLRAL